MKVALLADIHGNADALRAVLSAARAAGVEQLLVAGDIVGYYYEPDLVLDQVEEWNFSMVRGNHEDMLGQWRANRGREMLRGKFGSGLEQAVSRLTEARLERLASLKSKCELSIGGRSVLLCHGSPWDQNFYVYPTASEETRSRMLEDDYDLVVFGHTHFPVVWRDGQKTAANPGSVGQPRDGTPGACWALWDTAEHVISLRRESYDATMVVNECRRRDPHLPKLGERLINLSR